jgi:glutaconyl-CoA/methylmalonyl-CoA decarboxylase subunit gamma
MREFNITVNGKAYQVEVEEVGTSYSVPAAAVPVPVAAAPSPAVLVAAPVPVVAAPAPKAAEPVKKEAAPVQGGEVIASPMPGTILGVNVKPGDVVKRGQVLCILEAMKMENEIMAPHDGTIAQVGASKGSSVNTGDMLVVLA